MVSTGGGAFLSEDTTSYGGGVHFDRKEGSYFHWTRIIF